MSKSAFSALNMLVILCVAVFCTATVMPVWAASDNTWIAVTINDDGNIEPAAAPIQKVGNTYTLTNQVGSINIKRNNIILDGNGYTIPGKVSIIDALGNNTTIENSGGIFLKNVKNVAVTNFVIKNCQTGIYLDNCLNNHFGQHNNRNTCSCSGASADCRNLCLGWTLECDSPK